MGNNGIEPAVEAAMSFCAWNKVVACVIME
jgi:hypothetical protein